MMFVGFLEQEREADRDVVSDRLRDDVVGMMEFFHFDFISYLA